MNPQDVLTEDLGGFDFFQPAKHFRLGGDSLALSAFVRLYPGERVCDLGCGVGALSRLLLRRRADLLLDGLELDEDAACWGARNLEPYPQCHVLVGDIRDIRRHIPEGGTYTLVVSNPPYHGGERGAQATKHHYARCDASCPPEALCDAAAFLLNNGGRFCLCFPAERLTDWLVLLRARRLEPKRIEFRLRSDGVTARLALVEAQKSARNGALVTARRLDDR